MFGRVPRSLSRRLERAVVELRDEFEDLTQEQGWQRFCTNTSMLLTPRLWLA